MATKLTQHMAIENDKRTAAQKIQAETQKTFKGQDLFYGLLKRYVPKNEGGDPLPDERKELVTTVEDRLQFTKDPMVAMLDHMATKDKTNQKANADLVVDGKTIATALPATTLLALEKKLREIRGYYDACPTLDLSISWEEDKNRPGIFVHGPVETYRTAKTTKGVTLAPATEKFPAQIEKVTEDVTVGTFFTTRSSGALHPGTKSKYLAKIDKLIEAAKDARMRANQVETDKVEIGAKVFAFIHE